MRRRDFGPALGGLLLLLGGRSVSAAHATVRPRAWRMSDRLTAMVEARPELADIDVYERLKPAQRIFQAVWVTEREVNSDGFHGFFLYYGRLAPDAPAAFRAIGAPKMAAIIEQAMAALKGYVAWSDADAREAAIDDQPPQVEAALDKLDEAFSAYPEDLTALLYAYVAARSAEFGSMRTRD